MHSDIGTPEAASARGMRAELLDMVFGGLWPIDATFEALIDRVETSRDGDKARTARGVR